MTMKAKIAEAPPADWYSIRAKSKGDADVPEESAEILIYGDIGGGWFDEEPITAKKMMRDLKEISAKNISLRINSPGGSAIEGNAIYNALRRHPAKITTYVDGLAGSAASIIALAGDHVVMAPNAMFMIHRSSGMAMGKAADMKRIASLLDKTDETLAATYRERTGKTAAEVEAAMDAETWFNADEAVEWGLADEVSGDAVDIAANAWGWTLEQLRERYANAPQSLTLSGQNHRSESRPPTNNQEENTMDPKVIRARLGLAEDATEEQVLSKIDELAKASGDDQETPPSSTPDPATPGEDDDDSAGEKPADPPPATPNDGTVTVDAAALEELKRKAELGVAAKARQDADDRDRAIDAAIKAGKFPRARRDHWVTQWNADPVGAKATIDKLPAGLIPVGEELGHANSDADPNIDEAHANYMKAYFPGVVVANANGSEG